MSKSIPYALIKAKKGTFDRLEDVRVWPFASGSGAVFAVASIESLGDEKKAGQLFLDEVFLNLERLAKHPAHESEAETKFEESMQGMNDILKAWLLAHPQAVDIARCSVLVGTLTSSTLILTGFGQIGSIYLHAKGDGDEAYDLVRDIRREAAPSAEKLFRTVMMGVLESGDRALFGNTAALRLMPKEELAELLSTLPVGSAAEKISQRSELGAESVLAFILKSPEKQTAAQTSAKTSVEDLHRAESRTEDVLTRTPKSSKELAKNFGRWLIQTLSRGSSLFFTLLFSLFSLLFTSIKCLALMPFGPGRRERAKNGFAKSYSENLSRVTTKNAALTWPMRVAFFLFVVLVFWAALMIGKFMSQSKLEEIDREREIAITEIRNLMSDAEAKLIYRDDAGAKTALDAAEEKLKFQMSIVKTDPSFQELNEALAKNRKALRKEFMLGIQPGWTLSEEGFRIGLINKAPAVITKTGGLYLNESQVADTTLAPFFAWFGSENAFVTDANGTISSIGVDGTAKTLQGVAPNTLADATMYSGRVYAIQPIASAILRMDPVSGGFATARVWQKGEVKTLSKAKAIAIDSDIFVATSDEVLKFTKGLAQNFALGSIDPAPSEIIRMWTSETSNFLYLLEASKHRVIVVDKGNGQYVKQLLFDGLDGVTDFLVDEPAKTIYLLAGKQVLIGSM